MKIGKTLSELATEIERQKDAKRDFVATTTALTVLPPVRPQYDPTVSNEANGRLPDVRGLALAVGDEVFDLKPTFHEQLAGYTKIPKPYYDRMLSEAPALLAGNANHWLHASRAERLVRTLDGGARALLSDKYRPLDHYEMMEAVLPAVAEHGSIELRSCEVTERRLYLQFTSPRLEGEVRVGEVVQMGVTVTNSEIGMGRIRAEGLLYVLRCRNGMVTGEGFKRAHLGRRAEGMSEGAEEFFKSDTMKLSDAALFAQIRDVVGGLLTEASFGRTLTRMKEAAEVKIEADLPKVVEVTGRRLGLTGGEQSAMLRHLIDGGDLTKWGLSNAVTRLAHDAATYDRCYELERAGNDVIELGPNDWREIQKLAA